MINNVKKLVNIY